MDARNDVSKLGRLAVLLQAGFTEAATIKDDRELSRVMKHATRRAFNDYWNQARALVRQYDKVCEQQHVINQTDDSAALIWTAFDLILQSPDPVKAVALLEAFNKNEVEVV